MSSRRSAALLVPLACPACGGSLDPLAEDIVFLCPQCSGASELHGSLTAPRLLRTLVRAPATAGLMTGGLGESLPAVANGGAASVADETLYLPFWEFPTIAITPAFNGSRLLTLTRWYTERASALAGRSGPPPRGLWGGRIGSGDARRVLSLFEEPEPQLPPDGARPHAGAPADGAARADLDRAARADRSSLLGAPDPPTPARSAYGAPLRVAAPGARGPADSVLPPIAPTPGRGPAGAASVRLPDPSLLAIPFVVGENRLVCVATGLHVYFETLEGARDLIDRWRRPPS